MQNFEKKINPKIEEKIIVGHSGTARRVRNVRRPIIDLVE